MEINTSTAISSVEKPPGLLLHPLPPRVGARSTQQSNILRDELPFIPEKEEYQGKNAFLSPIDNDPEPRETEANFVEIGSDSTEGSESHEPMSFEDREMFLLRSPATTPETEHRSSLRSCKLEAFFSPLKSGRVGLDELSAGPPLLDLTRLMMQPLKPQNAPDETDNPQQESSDNAQRTLRTDNENSPDRIDNGTTGSFTSGLTDNGTEGDTSSTGNSTVLPQALLNQVTDIVRDKVSEGDTINKNIQSYSCTLASDVNQNVSTAGREDPPSDPKVESTKKVADTDAATTPKDMSKPWKAYDSDTNLRQKSWRQKPQGKKRKHGTATGESSRKEKKSRPNYFVAVQITNPQIKDNLREVQEHIVQQESLLSTAVVRAPTQHFTLHVSHLATDEDIKRAGLALDACREQLVSEWKGTPPPLLHIKGLGNFNHKVLFAKLDKDDGLDGLNKIADVVTSCLEREGIHSTDDRGFKPHLTIMKFSKDPSLFWKVKRIQPALYKAYEASDVGWQRVLGLQLCSMDEPKRDDGYYQVVHSVSFDLPEGEPVDGSAGRSTSFSPIQSSPVPVKEELVKDLHWNFHEPTER